MPRPQERGQAVVADATLADDDQASRCADRAAVARGTRTGVDDGDDGDDYSSRASTGWPQGVAPQTEALLPASRAIVEPHCTAPTSRSRGDPSRFQAHQPRRVRTTPSANMAVKAAG